MKVSCLNSVKFLKLKRRLKLKQWEAIGVLEALWLFTQNNQPAGNIGKRSNEDIAAGIEWEGDADDLLSNLLACGFIDEAECLADRLVVHEWEHHCPTWLKGALAKNNLTFSRAKQPAKQPAKQIAEQEPKQPASLPSVTLPNQAFEKDNTGANSSHDVSFEPTTEPTVKRKATSGPVEYSDDFLMFWEAYPKRRRVEKRKAWEAWKQAIKRAAPTVILDAVDEYAESKTGKGEFVKRPVSWLNGDCWDDSRDAWDPKAKSRVPTDEQMRNWNPVDGGLG